jgi:hypothetical protein
MTGPRFNGHGESNRHLVYEALQFLDMATSEQISLYTGLSEVQVRAVLKQERYSWCDLIDHIIHRGYSANGNWRSWETGVWQYQGAETHP